MINKQIRRANAIALMDELGGNKQFAEKTGLSDAQVSHIRTRVRNIGNQMARQIEDAFGKEPGWMDRDHSKELSSYAISVGEVMDQQGLSPQDQEKLANHLVKHIFALGPLMRTERRVTHTPNYPGDRRLNPFKPHSPGDTYGFPKVDDPGRPLPKPSTKFSPSNGGGKRKK